MKKVHKKASISSLLASLSFVAVVALGVLPGASQASIIGGDLNSIIGGDLNSIIGGDLNSIIGGDLAAIGPIESVDSTSKTVVVLGQSFVLATYSTITVAGKNQPLRGIKSLKVGDYIAVEAHSDNGRAIADRVAKFAVTYVSGASATFVRGIVSFVNLRTGVVSIGSLKADVTQLLGGQVELGALQSGMIVELAGTQPAAQGIFLAASGEVIDRGSIIGGDANSIIGGDANSIIGGDANSIIGGDANSIIGGDANSIIGGDANSIIGGDANSIIGGDANSIIGGDANSIIGGDANSIIGGDANSIIGGDMNSIIGGDLNSIIGGDRSY